MQLNAELLAGFKAHASGVGLANQQVAIAVDPGAKFGLTAAAKT